MIHINNCHFSFQNLSHSLQSGEISALDTLHAFQWKAIQVNKKQNCITQFLENAEDEAEKCDKIPLKGSIKRMFSTLANISLKVMSNVCLIYF